MEIVNDKNISEVLTDWYDYFSIDLKSSSYSKNTIELYSRIVAEFIEYASQYDGKLDLIDIKSVHLKNFLIYMDKKEKPHAKGVVLKKDDNIRSKATKETYRKAIIKFFNFISNNNDSLVSFDKTLSGFKVVSEKKTHEKIKYFTDEETQILNTAINEYSQMQLAKGNVLKVRYALLAKLMLYAGLRVSEARVLDGSKFADEDETFYRATIIGKGGEEQHVYIIKSLIKNELEFLTKHQPKGLLFSTSKGNPISRQAIYSVLSKLYEQFGIFGKKGCHILRHTLAMRMVGQGVDLVKMKEVLRHESIETTTKYAKATKQDAKDVAGIMASKVF